MYVILLPAQDEPLPLPTREIEKPYPLQKESKTKKIETNKTKGTKHKPLKQLKQLKKQGNT